VNVDPRLTLLGGVFGVTIVVFAIAYITAAILLYTVFPIKPVSLFSIGFTWFIIPAVNTGYGFGYQYLSELGIGPSATVYNYGVIITGLLSVCVFPILYKHFESSVITRIATVSGVVGCLALSGLGVYPMYIWLVHFTCALSFFAFVGLAILLFSYAMRSSGFFPKTLSWLGVAVVIGDIIGESIAVLADSPLGEYSAPFLFMVWLFALGITLLAQTEGSIGLNAPFGASGR